MASVSMYYFITPVIIDVHGHRLYLNVFELEGVINSRDCCFKFLNRSIPIFPELYNFEAQ